MGELRFEVEQVLGCDDRAIALTATLRGTMGEHGGDWENRYGYVTVIRAGRLVRLERYEADAGEVMLARYAELGSTEEPADMADGDAAAAWLARHDELVERGDPDALAAESFAPDVLVHDRRGFPASDREA